MPPSILQVRRCLPSLKKLGICALISSILLALVAIPVLFLIFLPYGRALTHEVAYFEEKARLDDITSQWQVRQDFPMKEWDDLYPPAVPVPYNERLVPLIHDVVQLSSWGWQEGLRLHEDGSAQYPAQEYWIYLGGTYRKRGLREILSLYTEPGGSCIDSPYICDAFNAAVNSYIERRHILGTERSSSASLGFVDCDASPLLCDDWGMDPVMLVHIRTHMPCRTEWPSFKMACSVTWRFVELPLKKMPFPITQKVGGHVVPVFPSSEEQIRAMVSLGGSQDAFEYAPHERAEFVVGDDYVFEQHDITEDIVKKEEAGYEEDT